MITIEKHYWLPKLKNVWEKLYGANLTLSVFQSYEFMHNFWRNSWVYGVTHRELPVFYLVLEDGIPRMIAPLCKKCDGSYEIMGNKNGCEYCDFIYAGDTNVDLYVDVLLKYLKRKVVFARIKDDSSLYRKFLGKDHVKALHEEACVSIALPDSYEAYYKSLHSSVRQNLRTSLNRLKRDGHSVSVKVLHDGGQVTTWNYNDKETLQMGSTSYSTQDGDTQNVGNDFAEMMALYYRRHAERYGERTSRLKMWYMKHLNFMSVSLCCMRSAISVMLFIDDELAAFMSGLVSAGKGDLIIPRLSINGNLGFYSPGMLLVNETARYLIDKTDNRNLDLSLGAETYKLKMGGVFSLSERLKFLLGYLLKGEYC